MLPTRVLLHGKDEPLAERRQLRAGPLTATWENGDLRYIALGDHEILRRVYVAVRDQNWGTVAPVMTNLMMDVGPDTFRITYDVENRQDEICFAWSGAISGESDGTIRFSMDGLACSTFRRNRIGFCVLHPAQAAGAAAQVTHVEGPAEHGHLPIHIVPSQPVPPFAEMQAMRHEVIPGVWAELAFEGEVFEMEDQRNWSDASYKTFGTPLRLPFPVEVEVGTRIAQSITLSLHDARPVRTPVATSRSRTTVINVDPTAAAFPLPEIGVGLASHETPLSQSEIGRIRALNLGHLRADVHLSRSDHEAAFRRAIEQSELLDLPIHLALFVAPEVADEQLAGLRERLDSASPAVSLFLVYPNRERFAGGTPVAEVVAAARRHLGDLPGARLAAGTNADYIFMARSLPPLDQIDALAFAIHPQEHAFDNASLVETLSTQAALAASARHIGGGLPVIASPVTLRRRFNPHAIAPEAAPPPGSLPAPVDPRQMSLFGACWTAGSVKYLATGGAASVTYFETTGWRGVMETETGSPAEPFRSLGGAVFPLYHVLAEAGRFRGGEVLDARSSDPLAVEGLALRKDAATSLLVSNMSGETQTVEIRGLGAPIKVRRLDVGSVLQAMHDPERFADSGQPGNSSPMELSPYATAILSFADSAGEGGST